MTNANDIIITSPADKSTITSPFKVAASATTCSSEKVTSIGFSLDNSGNTTAQAGTSLNAEATSGSGTHVVHVKVWSNAGTSCYKDVTVNVASPAAPASVSLVPANAKTVYDIQNMSGWEGVHDPGTPGYGSGSMSVTSTPSLSGHARRFNTSFSGSGGVLYTEYFGSDVDAKNFFYDAWVFLDNSAGNIGNIEMDMNQVLANGQTIIYGFQCDGYAGKWDYAMNRGTPQKHNDGWVQSNAYCDPRSWGRNQWHHVQVSYSRDDSGYVTYHSVFLDGVESKINARVPSAFALGWAPVLQTNFQVDGVGAGSNTVILDKLNISRW